MEMQRRRAPEAGTAQRNRPLEWENRPMMQSTMQDFPLNVGMIFRHGRALHGES
jgi:hypothetical protein